MVYVYRIEYAPEAPGLEVLDPRDANLLIFDGERKAGKWPSGGLKVKPVVLAENLFLFYRLAPGVLVYREDVIGACDDFYWIASQHIEPLQIVCGDVVFNLINIVDFMGPPLPGDFGYDTGAPCTVSNSYAPILKIKMRPPTELYCVSGLTNQMNEFKAVYDHYGFKGLILNEIWNGSPD